ncbi:MAG TPA: hypothetical protein DHU56_18405 [Marinobacter sp.]|nr:hypothetical protein [Marinobacter sp.]
MGTFLLRTLLAALLSSLLIPASGAAEDLLARADTRMPHPQTQPQADGSITRVLVRKSERRLFLLQEDSILRSYRISLGDNPEGHKLYEGDERTPEGDYTLDWRNPGSDFYKSIHVSYPNEQDIDKARAWGLDPGGSIMIHGLPNEAGDLAFAFKGLDWTDGCIAVTNEAMEEIWNLVPDGTPISILP